MLFLALTTIFVDLISNIQLPYKIQVDEYNITFEIMHKIILNLFSYLINYEKWIWHLFAFKVIDVGLTRHSALILEN